jgi:alkanesulfonate monooxygenase SsuD/methylene tetrahydromethanopterin reductase-like flavin-dependent oxidoreductase (luciferase family)
MKSSTLFLLNLDRIVDQDVWDNYRNKELAQAYQLRAFSDRHIAIAEKLDQLGAEFKCFPDANDYDEEVVESAKLYDEAIDAANAAFVGGYRDVADLIDELAEAAIGDFSD